MAHMLGGSTSTAAKSVSWPWYHFLLTHELTPDARCMLEQYSGVESGKIESHIYRIRDRAWGLFPWPCVGEFCFLNFGLAKHPLYRTVVLPRLRAGALLLDLGTCLGQDVRRCIFDGAPPSSLYASDLFPEYEGLAHELWRDQNTFPLGRFISDDILADNDTFNKGPLMSQLGPGQIDMISINMFLHLFDWINQLKAATRILRLLSHKPGSLILGSQAGSVDHEEMPLRPPFAKPDDGDTKKVFRHNPESFERLWTEASKAAGVPLRVNAELKHLTLHVDSAVSGVEKRNLSPKTQGAPRLYFSIVKT